MARKRKLRIKRSWRRLGPSSWARRQKAKHMKGGRAVSQHKYRKIDIT